MKVRETVENPASLQSAHMVVQQDKMSCGSRDVKWSYTWRLKLATRSSLSSSRNSTVSYFAMVAKAKRTDQPQWELDATTLRAISLFSMHSRRTSARTREC